MSADLFGDPLACPYISVTLLKKDRPEDVTRSLVISYQAGPGAPYLTICPSIDVYSPEWSILRAASEMFLNLEGQQRGVTSNSMREAWARASAEYVAPF